jgi:myo-inositol-1(or 4)-monophosphatase
VNINSLKKSDLAKVLNAISQAARASGQLMRDNWHSVKRANLVTQLDIKLELDVRSQELIQKALFKAFPDVALLGEEGVAGDSKADFRWVVDPIDGTVNFAYGIPHACVSIAFQQRAKTNGPGVYPDGYETLVGVVYDPFCDELWSAIRGGPARCNGKVIHVSTRNKIKEAVISIGFSKSRKSLEASLPYFNQLVRRVRKVRIMGAAAIALTYVASGRFDAYVERRIRLWDIAAGGLIIECAGGKFCWEEVEGEFQYSMIASNGLVSRSLKMPK